MNLSPDVWQAARLAAGEDVPGASDAARELAARAAADADRSLMDDLSEHDRKTYTSSGKTGPRVSDAGACGRSVWYREHPPADYTPAEPVDDRRAALGRALHKAIEIARRARYPWRFFELEVPVPGLDKVGRIDEYDPVLGRVTDDKTAGSRKWASITAEGPEEHMWQQVRIYGLALEALGMPVRTLQIIVLNRDTGAEEPFEEPYSPASAWEALDELVMLGTLLDLGVVPQREGDGPGSWPCNWCEARNHCWNVQAATEAGRSPESYTLLGKHPDSETIEWAARQHHDAVKGATAADKTKAWAASLLEGVPSGTYGSMVVTLRERKIGSRIDRWVQSKPVKAAKGTGK